MVQRFQSFWVVAIAGFVLIVGTVSGYLRFSDMRESVARGAALYAASPGSELQGRMTGHAEALPALATRCSNCHLQPGADTSKLGPDKRFGPVLTAEHLLQAKARRGGPPTVFDEASFCRVLREGLDPAMVIIDQTMPRYSATPAQCTDLWNYLSASH